MSRLLALSGSFLVLAVCLGTDCQGNLPAGSSLCVIDDGPGFKITLPCDATRNQSQGLTAGLSYEQTFTGSDNVLYSLEVVSAATLDGGGSGGASLGSQGNLRFEGVMTTYSGDLIVLQTLRFDFGDFFRAITILGDGSMLRAGIMAPYQSRDQQLLTLLSVDVTEGDGSEIRTWRQQDTPKLLAPFHDEFVLLDDNSVWRISSSDKISVATWSTGDAVFGLLADRFYVEAFLTRIPDWISIPASYLGFAELLQVVSVDSSYSCADVTLSDGSVWTACTDVAVLNGLAIGETVALFTGSYKFIMQLSTGKSALVIP